MLAETLLPLWDFHEKKPKILTILIYISGYVPALCHSTNLTTEGKYILLVGRHSQGRYEPVDVEMSAEKYNLDEIATVCNLKSKAPEGVYF